MPDIPPVAPAFAHAAYDPSVPGGQIKLSWTNTPNNETGFKIYRETSVENNGSSHLELVGSTAADQTTYTDTNEKDDGPYYYRIYAFNSAGESKGFARAGCTENGQVIVLLKGDNISGILAGVVNKVHESVGLGHYNNQGKIVVDAAWSFGGDGTFRYFAPEALWLGFSFPLSVENIGGPHGLYSVEGSIYPTDGFGTVIASKVVTRAQASSWLSYMGHRSGTKDIYDPFSLNCVTYSQLEYAIAP